MTIEHPMFPPAGAEIIQFSAARLAPRRSEKIQTSTRVGEDIGDNLPEEFWHRKRPLPEPQTDTCKNQRLRDARKGAWNAARSSTEYCHARWKWKNALETAQRHVVADANTFPDAKQTGGLDVVVAWRHALVKQLLTPAPDLGSVTWKRAQLAGGQYVYVGVKRERIEAMIEADATWLAAHPTKRSEAATRKPEAQQ
jgi:hypothetical protein